MKFWRISILTALLFFSTLAIVMHTSCEQNVCNNVQCYNGGACNSSTGICSCPVGYTGSLCQDSSRGVFLGTFVGHTVCTVGFGETTDTITVTPDLSALNWVYVTESNKILFNGPLHGYISPNAATYTIVVQADTAAHYQQIYEITLQGDQNMILSSFTHDMRVPTDTINNDCSFTGSKQ